MNKPIQSIFMLCLSVMLLACGKDADHQNINKAYDYRDERHQDFYSRYMRKTQKDYLSPVNERIQNPKRGEKLKSTEKYCKNAGADRET